MDQRTEEWFEARMGCVTASRTADVMAKTKSGYAASRANYMAELICERLTGERQGGFSSAAMQWGTETEPQARMAYEIVTGATVVETGFVLHPEIAGFGASPDGLIDEDGLIEIKCPNTATHIDTLLNDKVPGKYITQMHVQMLCTGRKWCDFVSFDPRLPVDMQMFVRRVEFDQALAAEIVTEVQAFIAEMENKIEQLKARTA
jgi:putative phage-type endonuclease